MNTKILFFTIRSITALLVVLVFTLQFNIQPVLSEIFISPSTVDITDPAGKSWVSVVAKPGELLTQSFTIENTASIDELVSISAKDMITSSSGQSTLLPDSTDNTVAGNWINLSQNSVTIPANSSIQIPFIVSVPMETKSGEYGAGIVITADSQSPRGAVSIKLRKGLRVYVTVPGVLSQTASVEQAKIVHPNSPEFELEKSQNPSISRNTTLVSLPVTNTGNIYSKLTAELQLRSEGVKPVEYTYRQELVPDSNRYNYYVFVPAPYQKGLTSLTMRYKIEPLNTNSETLKLASVYQDEGISTHEINIDQSDLSVVMQPSSNQKTEESKETESTSNSINQIWYWVVGGLIFLIVGGGTYWFVRRKIRLNKNSSKDLS